MEKSIQFIKKIPYYGHFDVVVLGGGPAGVYTYKGEEQSGVPQPAILMLTQPTHKV